MMINKSNLMLISFLLSEFFLKAQYMYYIHFGCICVDTPLHYEINSIYFRLQAILSVRFRLVIFQLLPLPSKFLNDFTSLRSYPQTNVSHVMLKIIDDSAYLSPIKVEKSFAF